MPLPLRLLLLPVLAACLAVTAMGAVPGSGQASRGVAGGGSATMSGESAWNQTPIEGHVSEAGRGPIPAARVELLSDDRVLAVAATDAEGRFRLVPPAGWGGTGLLRVSRLGYTTVALSIESPWPFQPIELTPAPITLAGFEVDGERDLCSAPEDREARALWGRAAALALGGLDTLGIASYTRFRVDTVAAGVFGPPGIEGAEDGQRASAPLLRLNWERRVQREGYAFPVRRTDAERSYDSWSYPPLEADFAPHFASNSFGRQHAFQLVASDSAGWILHFCGRNTGRPYLSGTLELGPDTLLMRVEWRFRTTEPDEAAGGWARFPPPAGPAEPQLLLPTESVTWRTTPGGETLRRAHWYEGWELVAGDSVPFLPDRSFP